MSEWRYHLLFRLGVILKRAGVRLIEYVDFDPCACERDRLLTLIREHGQPTRGPAKWRTVSTTAPATSTFTSSVASTYYLKP